MRHNIQIKPMRSRLYSRSMDGLQQTTRRKLAWLKSERCGILIEKRNACTARNLRLSKSGIIAGRGCCIQHGVCSVGAER